MNRRVVSLGAVVDRLIAEGLLQDARADEAVALIERLRGMQPWYVRGMVAFGAWLASLLLIGFVAGFGLALGGSTVIGLILTATAVWVRRRPALSDNDFVVQSTLAVSLAGQALFAWGIADLLPGDDFKLGCATVLIVSSVLFFLFPDRVHRVLMVLLASGSLVLLIYAFELNGLVPVVGPALATALVLLHQNRATLTAQRIGQLASPLENGLMLSAFGCLLISTVYLLPELAVEFVFYPWPWISTMLLGALLLYVGGRTWPTVLDGGNRVALPIVHTLMVAVIAAAWAAPGLLLALIVILLGTASGHRSFIGAGIAFLAVFTGAYFYGIEVTMLTKSVTLVTTGIAILTARWLLLRVLGAPLHG